MALFEHWEYQYQFSHVYSTPYEGHVYSDALYEKDKEDARIAYIILNRPEKANALTDKMNTDILAGLHQAADDPEVRVVIMKGNGRGFCAGHDLGADDKEVDGRPGRQSSIMDPKYRPAIRDYFNLERRRCSKDLDCFVFPKILMTQVHGYAIWYGEFFVRMSDFCIAADDTRFGAWGQSSTLAYFYVGNTWWYGHPSDSKNEGRGRPTEVTGKRAVEAGLINKAVPKDDLDAEARRWARLFADVPPESLMLAKSLINGMLFAKGLEVGKRGHWAEHISMQFTRFRPGEVGLYKLRRNAGTVSAFIDHRKHRTELNDFRLPWRSK